jgi:phosphatidylserine/phosphatidylglycerophosphate/cardiolipin synthase-like enzyme
MALRRLGPTGVNELQLHPLTDGGQRAEKVAGWLTGYLSEARKTLELALYDVRLPGDVGDAVARALTDAVARGVQVRLLYNVDQPRPIPVPPPPNTRPDLIEALPFPTRDVPGEPDLMHHKYVVRDGEAVWTGSANWTLDSWQRQENVIAIVSSPELATAYRQNFDELWERRKVEKSGFHDPRPVPLGGATVRAWFCPGRGRALTHRIADAVDGASRVRIASPVISSGPVLGTLAQVVSDGRADVAGVVDATQIAQVLEQWDENGNSEWKYPLLARVVSDGRFTGKRSTPYRPDALHDYMHAKVAVADGTAFVGSFNLSRSGEMNAENVLEIEDASVADRLADYVDQIRARFPAMPAPPAATPGPGRRHTPARPPRPGRR